MWSRWHFFDNPEPRKTLLILTQENVQLKIAASKNLRDHLVWMQLTSGTHLEVHSETNIQN